MRLKAVWHQTEWDKELDRWAVVNEVPVTIIQIGQLVGEDTLAIAVTGDGGIVEEHINDFKVLEFEG